MRFTWSRLATSSCLWSFLAKVSSMLIQIIKITRQSRLRDTVRPSISATSQRECSRLPTSIWVGWVSAKSIRAFCQTKNNKHWNCSGSKDCKKWKKRKSRSCPIRVNADSTMNRSHSTTNLTIESTLHCSRVRSSWRPTRIHSSSIKDWQKWLLLSNLQIRMPLNHNSTLSSLSRNIHQHAATRINKELCQDNCSQTSCDRYRLAQPRFTSTTSS